MVDEPVPPIAPEEDDEGGDVLDPPPPFPNATAAPAPAATPAMMTPISVFEMPCDAGVAAPDFAEPGVAAPPVAAFAAVTVR